MAIGILICFLIVCIILLYSKIIVTGSVTINKQKQTMEVTVYFCHIRLMERSINLMNEEPDQTHSFHDTLTMIHNISRHFVQKINGFHEVSTLILERLHVHELTWHTEIGTGKAHTTGMAAGGIWGAKGAAVGILSAKCHLKCQPSIVVTPFFNQKRIDSAVDCMISIRAGQAIYALLKIIRKLPAKREAAI
ncbi:DUF2953 domain-containing protein [Lentibacillus salinarum]|uniref:DUF2953 domain-containing protein n=1 Tax=Lentibacillus salinarum TaxID=446820 RepID=A0ABW3ZV25_9BACI